MKDLIPTIKYDKSCEFPVFELYNERNISKCNITDIETYKPYKFSWMKNKSDKLIRCSRNNIFRKLNNFFILLERNYKNINLFNFSELLLLKRILEEIHLDKPNFFKKHIIVKSYQSNKKIIYFVCMSETFYSYIKNKYNLSIKFLDEMFSETTFQKEEKEKEMNDLMAYALNGDEL